MLLLSFSVAGQQIGETVTVERVIVDARVTNFDGVPVRGLQPKDFRVRIDGKDALVESVTWVSETALAREQVTQSVETSDPAPPPPPPSGRVMVFLVQTDFARDYGRSSGQMGFAHDARTKLLDMLEPGDRIAVLSLDSHLKFRLDFTDDRTAIEQAIAQTMRMDEPPPPTPSTAPSLTALLDREQLRKTSRPEEALLLLGEILGKIPGPKSLLLCGWGFGNYYMRSNWVTQSPEYDRAAAALQKGRVNVFAIDTPKVGTHSLWVSLRKVAENTGGYYGGASSITYNRLRSILSGHYELEVRPATTRRGEHSISVKVLTGRDLRVMARSAYADGGDS
ncbi:MAG: hypothetical protein JOZ54_15250 [Acidobacteria bacterium]|nr:hypothetical protein [Acidobacteriota bacterium]